MILPNSDSLLNHSNFIQAFLSVAATPSDPELQDYFKLEELSRHLDEIPTSEYIEELRLNPGIAEMIEQRYFGPKYKLEDLKRECPPGSLGYVYYHHMTENGIPAYDYSAFESPDDASYIQLRKMQTHDIWHVVTGYNTNLIGELSLQGFYQGQGPTVYQTLLMSALVLHFATIQTKQLSLALEGLFEGWQRGRAARPLWGIRWEEMWETPLVDIQNEYNILPPREFSPTEKILSLRI